MSEIYDKFTAVIERATELLISRNYLEEHEGDPGALPSIEYCEENLFEACKSLVKQQPEETTQDEIRAEIQRLKGELGEKMGAYAAPMPSTFTVRDPNTLPPNLGIDPNAKPRTRVEHEQLFSKTRNDRRTMEPTEEIVDGLHVFGVKGFSPVPRQDIPPIAEPDAVASLADPTSVEFTDEEG